MKSITKATKGCGKFSSNETLFSDIYFRGVKPAEGAMAEGLDYCMHVKISHKGFSWIRWKN